MFGLIRKWNASRQRRFQDRVAKHLKMHFGEVMGGDAQILDEPDAIDRLYRKYHSRT